MNLTSAGLERLREDVGELVARHIRATKTVDFTRYEADPVGFMRDVLKWNPWSKQVEVAESVRDHRFTVVRGCNGSGKDAVAAALSLWWVYARGGRVLLESPTDKQTKSVMMVYLHRLWCKDLPGEMYEMSLRLGRGEEAGILAFTANTDVSKLTGFHAARLLIVLSEAQDIPEAAWEGAFACASNEDARILAVGNPLNPVGRFFTSSRAAHWHSIRISALECPNIVEGREVIPGGVSQAFVDNVVSEYGRDSAYYVSRVLGEFPETSDEALVTRAWIDAAFERFVRGTLDDQAVAGEWVAACDPARMGSDHTALAIRKGPVLQDLLTWSKQDTIGNCDRMQEEFDRRCLSPYLWFDENPAALYSRRRGYKPIQRVLVDVVGLGAGVADVAKQRGWSVKEYNGGWSPGNEHAADKKKYPRRDVVNYMNRRAESFWGLRRLLETNAIALPPDEKLAEELMAIRWGHTAGGKIQIESKDEFRSRVGRSCDRADAVAMCFHGVYRPQSYGWMPAASIAF